MPWVRVKDGLTYGMGGKYPGGSVIEVTDDEIAAFGDKLEPAEEPTLDQGSDEEVLASDSARTLAARLDVDLAEVDGTGKDGKILVQDVKVYITDG